MTTSWVALRALMLRDLVVLKKNLTEFVDPHAGAAVLALLRLPLRLPEDRSGHRRRQRAPAAGESAFATVLVPGVVGISIMFQGVQSVALQMAQEFGFTREIEDRVQAPCPIWLVAMSKVLSGAHPGDHLGDHRAADRLGRPRRGREA